MKLKVGDRVKIDTIWGSGKDGWKGIGEIKSAIDELGAYQLVLLKITSPARTGRVWKGKSCRVNKCYLTRLPSGLELAIRKAKEL